MIVSWQLNGDPKPGDAELAFRRKYNQREFTREVTKLQTRGGHDGRNRKPPCLLALGKPDQRHDPHAGRDQGNQQWRCQAQAESCAQYDAEDAEDDHWTRDRFTEQLSHWLQI